MIEFDRDGYYLFHMQRHATEYEMYASAPAPLDYASATLDYASAYTHPWLTLTRKLNDSSLE